MGSVYDMGHNVINGPPASAGALGVVQGQGAWQVSLEALLEEAALNMDRPGGGCRADVSSAAQGESGCDGKSGWALGCPAHRQVLEAGMRIVAFMHRHGAVRQYSRRPPPPGLPEGSRINNPWVQEHRAPICQPQCLPQRE